MRIIFIVLFNFLLVAAHGQISSSYQWTWIHGDNVINQFGTYGQKGVESALNKPGSRSYSSNWIDTEGNFWLFGGFGFAASAWGALNDLWRYNVKSNQWTWMAGDSVVNSHGKWGKIGEESFDFTPTAREGAACWTDGSKTVLYLNGGFTPWLGYVYHGDVWAFSTLTNKWGTVKAAVSTDTAVCVGQIFGDVGEFTEGVWPVCRAGATAASEANRAYVFGGATPTALFYDLYQFSDWQSTPANQWAYLAAPKLSSRGVYRSPRAEPGSRRSAMSFVYNNTFYVFGGWGYDAIVGDSVGVLGDLWRYDGTALITKKPMWTWMHGDSVRNTTGKYGALGVADQTTKPPAREIATITPEGNGSFILFGGTGYGSLAMFNDVWRYDVTSNTWTWISGTNMNETKDRFTPANFGAKGVQVSSNVINSRQGHVTWISNGELYVFGGQFALGSYGNDLWKFSAPVQLISIDAIRESEVCEGNELTTTLTYSVHPQGSNPFNDTNSFIVEMSNINGEFINPIVIGNTIGKISGTMSISTPAKSAPGEYKIRIRSNSPAFTSQNFSQSILVKPIPPMPVITEADSILFSSAVTGNQWFSNGTPIEGAVERQYKPTDSGDYSVQVIENGCPSLMSDKFGYVITSIADRELQKSIGIYPNPFHDRILIANKTTERLSVEVHDVYGKQIAKAAPDESNYEFDLSSFPQGLYIVTVISRTSNGSLKKIVVKQ